MNKTTSQSEDYLQKELKAARYQLSQAERRTTTACENRDALVLKLENATDKVAELERTLEVAVRVFLIYLMAFV
jgi:hypothetical protein